MDNNNELKIINRIPITKVVDWLGIERRGNTARCPHSSRHKHNDEDFSLSFDLVRNQFRCWVCPDVGGSVLDLVMLVCKIPLPEAAKLLREEFIDNATCKRVSFTDGSALGRDFNAIDDEIRFKIYEEIVARCETLTPKAWHFFVEQKGISEQTLRRMKICVVSDYKGLLNYLKRKYPLPLLQKSGVFNEKGHLVPYKHRVIIPFLKENRIVHLLFRSIDQQVEPKYLNLRNISVPCLYNIDCLQGLPAGSPVIIVESVLDALAMLDRGHSSVLSTLGASSFKPNWIEELIPYEVYLCFHSDKAGQAGAEHIAESLKRRGKQSQILYLPRGISDWVEFFRECDEYDETCPEELTDEEHKLLDEILEDENA